MGSILKLNYEQLNHTAAELAQLAARLDNGCHTFSAVLRQGMSPLAGELSPALEDAEYFVSRKISELDIKATYVAELSRLISTLAETAVQADAHVCAMIEDRDNRP